jgi:hypothetical protein
MAMDARRQRKPVILAVDRDESDLQRLETELDRYVRDYDVVLETSGRGALDTLDT